MKLSVKERLVITSILPQEGDRITWKVLQKLKTDLGFSEEELTLYKFENLPDGTIRWDDKAEQGKEVEIGEKAFDIISQALKRLDEQKKLRAEHLDIYDRFTEKE